MPLSTVSEPPYWSIHMQTTVAGGARTESTITNRGLNMKKPEPLSFTRKEIAALLAGVFAVSFAVLTFEVSLTRVFSVMFSYHYAFLVVAVAFAGLGIGGILAQLIPAETSKKGLFTSLALTYLLFALLTAVFMVAVTSIRAADFMFASMLFFLSFIPAGLFLSISYRVFAKQSNVLYAADVVGASLGSIGAVTFFNSWSPIFSIVAVCVFLSAVSFLFAFLSSKKAILGLTVVVLVLVASTGSMMFYSSRDVPIGNSQDKDLYALLNDSSLGARIVESRWSAFGRTDLVEFESHPHNKAIFVDGGAGTEMYHFNGNLSSPNDGVGGLMNTTLAYPLYFANRNDALVIGPGAGVDVLVPLLFNFSHIHAVEINKDTVDIVREYSDYDGGIYSRFDNVHVHVDEGRSFVERNPATYDVIILNIPITKTVQGTSGYSMSENYLFTVDSFKDYMNSLNDNGYLIVVAHGDFEIYRLSTTALTAFESEGRSIEDSMRQVVAVQGMGHSGNPAFILKKTAFSSSEIGSMYGKLSDLQLRALYLPYLNATMLEHFDPVLSALADGHLDLGGLIDVAAKNGLDVNPPTDDSPFFYKFDVGLPPSLLQLLAVSVGLAVAMTVVYLFVWGRRLNKAFKKERLLLAEKFSAYMPFYFATLGFGFMLIEVALIQKFILTLGAPAVAISIVLFSLLVSMAVGSFFSKRWIEQTSIALKAALFAGVIVILYSFGLPLVFRSFLTLDIIIRAAAVFSLIFPLGFLMGIPFPAGVKIMNNDFYSGDVSWMWGINGLYSLVGSTLAVVIAMSFGFNLALLTGAAAYILIFAVGTLRNR